MSLQQPLPDWNDLYLFAVIQWDSTLLVESDNDH